ncbi:ATP-binding protein [Kitasatospora sp. NPDC101176]|uniref:ATP-binding protein n=1 Tax=Kitasatospora sp. NPDC101176 TaxID=3364099 RepID=UPI003800967C
MSAHVPAPAGELADEPLSGPVDAGRAVTTAAQARAVITGLLDHVPGDTGAARRDAHLAATELVTNALRHGGGLTAFRARLVADATVLCIEVEDATSQCPREPEPDGRDPSRLGGRGWMIVRRISATCTVRPLPTGGKRISITVPVR